MKTAQSPACRQSGASGLYSPCGKGLCKDVTKSMSESDVLKQFSVLPYCGSVLPYCGSVLPYCGSVLPYCGSVLPYRGSVLPYCGSVLPYCGSVLPYCGSVLPYRGSVLPYCGSVLPYCGSVLPYCGSVLPYYGRSCKLDLLPHPLYSDTGPTDPSFDGMVSGVWQNSHLSNCKYTQQL